MKPYLVALFIIIIDRISKWFVVQHMTLGDSIPLIGNDLLRFTYIQNPGIAFGIPLFSNGFLIIFKIVTILILAIYLFHIRSNSTFLKIPLNLILGGATGNLIDRIHYGKVIDFIDADFPNFVMERWPVFNVADSAISIGMCLLIIYLIFQPRATESSIPPSIQ